MDSSDNSYQQAGERRLDLLFAFEALPDSSPEALAFLCHWLNAEKNPAACWRSCESMGWRTI
ncbi:hypothetical protein ACFS4T_31660 [Pseudomonas lini]